MNSIDCDVTGHISLQRTHLSRDIADENVQSSPTDPWTDIIEREGSRMDGAWKQAMRQRYEVLDRYNHVAALIVRWDDELDKDLNCKFEANELNSLFKEDFYFNSTVLKLDTRSRPQQQLNHAIADLVRTHDGPCQTNLLIVYYSGHSGRLGDSDLVFAGTPKDDLPILEGGGRYEAALTWSKAERDLNDAEADVLIVLDCCMAAHIMNKEVSIDVKAHEVLAASGRRQVAEQPGPRSFTRHFIDALREQLKENNRKPFSTFNLNEVITRRRLEVTPIESKLFNRHPNARRTKHIELAPLDHLRAVECEEAAPRPEPRYETASLDLRLGFKDHTNLSNDEVERLAIQLFGAAMSADLGITSIDWLGFKPRKDVLRFRHTLRVFLAVYYAKRWKRLIRRNKKRKASSLPDEGDLRVTKRSALSISNGALSPSPSVASSIG